ncbi:MAG: C25 family cysteine peptidase [Bacteroidota bacterium]
MHKLILSCFLFFCIIHLNAANNKKDLTPDQASAKIELISSDIQTSVVRFSFDDFITSDVQTSKGSLKNILLNGAFPLQIAGAPDLLKISTSLIIPDDAEMQAEVISKSFTDYPNINIAPSKGNLYRNFDPSQLPYIFGKKYTENRFFPGQLAELQTPYILRDYRGQTLAVYPFQYNPVTKVLRVYKDLMVKISRIGKSKVNVFSRTPSTLKIDNEYCQIYKNQFLNSASVNAKYTPVNEQGKMLIICYETFMPAMQALVNWKNISGIPTEMVSFTNAGSTSAAIKTYISNYYTVHGLTYVILVGDVAQIPTFTVSGGGSDNTYSYLTGSDHYPEIFVGRISAENISQVQTQVQKILAYEKNPSTSSNWLNKGIGIASDQGPGDNNEYDYQHIRAIRTKLLNYQYTNCAELYDGTQGGLDASGNPTATMVVNEINNGAGIIYYTGHGSDNSWGTTGFSNTNIASLTNTSSWPFIFSVACVNGNFTAGTCFAETWMRATYNTQPAGAIATLMSTINQSWNPPMCGQDAMIDLLTESLAGNSKHSFGGITMNGCMKMNDNYTTAGDEMTDTWNIFGDPSLIVRSDTAKTMAVTHNSVIYIGATSFTVNCNVEGARITLSTNNLSFASALVSNGIATFNFNALTSQDSITVVATAYNCIPYTGHVNVIIPSGPFIQINTTQIVDATANNNSLADYNENISLNVDLKNAGVNNASNVVATLSTSDTNVIITSNQHSWGNIAANTVSTQNNAFALTVKNNVPDQHVVHFNLSIADGASNTWNTGFDIVLYAPVLNIVSMSIEDNAPGNQNGRLDLGETASLRFIVQNSGHSNSTATIANLTTPNSFINIGNPTLNLSALPKATTTDLVYTLTANSSAAIGANYSLNLMVNTFPYTVQRTFNSMIGWMVEDFETHNFCKYEWDTTTTNSWVTTNIGAYEGSYCAKSAVIADNQTSSFSISLNVLCDDSISFFKKVSSELDYDFLNFTIDGNLMDKWSGNQAWARVSFPIAAGMHLLSWDYVKDYTTISGSDCAWVDFIVLPAVHTFVNIQQNKEINENWMEVYPNPFSKELTVEYSTKENAKLFIYNAIGQIITPIVTATSSINEKQRICLNLASLEKGIYFIQLKTASATSYRKLIKVD